MDRNFKVSTDQMTELRDIRNNLVHVMRHISVSLSDSEEKLYRKSMQKMVLLNKIQADKLKEDINTVSEEDSTESER